MHHCRVPGPFFLEKQTGRGVGRDAEWGNGVEGESWRSVRSLPNKCWEAADSLKSVRPAVFQAAAGEGRSREGTRDLEVVGEGGLLREKEKG